MNVRFPGRRGGLRVRVRATGALRIALLAALCIALAGGFAAAARLAPAPATSPTPAALAGAPLAATVTVALDRPVNSFRPDRALGAGLDGHGQGETAQIYTSSNERLMASAGLRALSYRLRTELGVEAWHFNPAGAWSDRANHQGYWTSSGRPGKGEIARSFGYGLPRRGDSVDQANNSGYSRLDDGDPRSFWKSNPYLDPHFTGEPAGTHPQWVLLDLGFTRRGVDAIRIDWAAPYATRFAVQYWVGPSAVLLAGQPPEQWADFPAGRVRGHGGSQTVRLSTRPLSVRFVRVLMSASSHTAPAGAGDVRDRLGYAIRELYLGTLHGGRLHDLVHHVADGSRQTFTLASSTDPWHRASDLDVSYEQPGFDTVAASGLTRGQPLLVPVPVLYGTPENAVSELRWLVARHIPLRGVELGEEPDGQLATPEDYGALYVQYERAIQHAFPGLPVGGPSLQTSIPDWYAWPDARGDRSWTHRFLDFLRARGALSTLAFFSFEWYPFDNTCDAPGPQLARAARTLDSVIALQRDHGLPQIPIYMSEYGYSSFAGQAEADLPGALLNADIVGRFLNDGGTSAYLYGYEPASVMRELPQCDGWGNLALLQSDDSHRALRPFATYWAAQMLTGDWAQPGDRVHRLYATTSSARDAAGNELVRAYAVRRPDGRLAVILLNVDPEHAYDVRVEAIRGGVATRLGGALSEAQLSSASYVWHAADAAGLASPDLPPLRAVVPAGAAVRLPPYSMTVVRWRERARRRARRGNGLGGLVRGAVPVRAPCERARASGRGALRACGPVGLGALRA